MHTLLRTALPLSILALATSASADRSGQHARDEGPRSLQVHEEPTAPGIAWFGTWEQALAEAQRTGRPILFHSAAPRCQSVPGVW